MHLDRTRLKSGLLLAGAIGFIALAQLYLTQRREYVWDAIVFLGIGLACFANLIVTVTRRFRDQSPRPTLRERGTGLLARRWSLPLVLALILNLIAARSANTQPPPTDYRLSILLWLASLILLYAAVTPVSHLMRGTQGAIRNTLYKIRNNPRYATELASVLALLCIGLLLRVWDLEHIPANLSGDEGTQGVWALDVLNGRLRNPFATGWYTVPTMSFFAQAASLSLFGKSVAGLRTVSALIGTATLAVTYLLARRTLGQRVALLALAALTFNHYHIHFSRVGSNQIADPFFMALAVWLLGEGLRRSPSSPHASDDPGREREDTNGDKRYTAHGPEYSAPNTYLWFLTAGLTAGLSWFGYFGSRVIALVIAAYLGAQAIMEQGFLRRHGRALALMALTALLVASPLLLYYADHPQDLSARFNQVSFFRWLENERQLPDHDSTFNLVLRQVWRSISAFNHTLDPTFWYYARIPLLDSISGILFILGLAVAVSQWRRPAVRLILLWFGLALIFGWVLTENPPSSMRMVIIAPALALIVALGLDRLLTLAHWTLGGRRAQWNWMALTIVAVAAFLNVYYYFIVYTPTRIFGNPTAETATVLARYLREDAAAQMEASQHDPDQGEEDVPFVYFYGPPFLYYDFGAIQFIAGDVPGISVPPKDQDPDFRPQIDGPTLIVVLRERLDELSAIQMRHPYGSVQEFYSEADGRLMFVIYEVPR